jgi:Uma2 family endonuclease
MSVELWDITDEEAEEFEDMPNFEHGILSTNISRHLGNYLATEKLGRVVDGSPEYRFLTKPADKKRKPYRQPDVSYVQKARLPKRFSDYPEIAPDFAVEVVSPTDRDQEIEAKVALYQKHGVKLIWIVHPFSRTIDIYRLDTGLKRENITVDDELSGEDVIPGFILKVSDIFDYPPDPEEEAEETDAGTPFA